MKDYPWGKGTVKTATSTSTLSASLFVVPANKIWKPITFISDVTAGAGVGNRTLYISATSGANYIMRSILGPATAATKVCGVDCVFGSGFGSSTTVRLLTTSATVLTDFSLNLAAPELFLPAGATLKVSDAAGIAGTDVIVAYLHYVEYDA